MVSGSSKGIILRDVKMQFLIVPLGLIHRGLEKVFGKKELDDLSSDLVKPVAEFVDEVYDDTVGDAAKKLEGGKKHE